ncbi:MAG: hypothetical protein U0791_20060 [Gemmataceae bacterium]
MTRAELVRINRKRVEDGDKPYENCRNLGTLKLLDPKELREPQAHAFAYGVGAFEGIALNTQMELFDT